MYFSCNTHGVTGIIFAIYDACAVMLMRCYVNAMLREPVGQRVHHSADVALIEMTKGSIHT
jgi:hypothetical protein